MLRQLSYSVHTITATAQKDAVHVHVDNTLLSLTCLHFCSVWHIYIVSIILGTSEELMGWHISITN